MYGTYQPEQQPIPVFLDEQYISKRIGKLKYSIDFNGDKAVPEKLIIARLEMEQKRQKSAMLNE